MIWLIRGVFGHRKNFVNKRTEISFSIFIENKNWDLNLIFQFDNENEKRKKLKIQFHFKISRMSLSTHGLFCLNYLVQFLINKNWEIELKIKNWKLILKLWIQSVHRKYHSIVSLKLKCKSTFLHISIFNLILKIEKW